MMSIRYDMNRVYKEGEQPVRLINTSLACASDGTSMPDSIHCSSPRSCHYGFHIRVSNRMRGLIAFG